MESFDLTKMSIGELDKLGEKIRRRLIDIVSKNGGHLAPNLGVVELTVALHKVFDFSVDKLIFDVGHQSYVHKLLTKRWDSFETLRQKGGISPFMDPEESSYDPIITGHAGSALPVGSGIAEGDKDKKVVVVLGDASISNGHSLEALNDVGGKAENLIIVLNDNEMSIDKNVGSLSNYFSKLMSTKGYINLKKEVTLMINKGKVGTKVTDIIKRFEHSVRHFMAPLSISENLGFTYLGVVDGHNLDELIENFEKAKEIKGPIFVHVKTKKGRGYKPAEENKEKFHGIAPFNKKTGEVSGSQVSYTSVFSKSMVKFMKEDKDIYGISAGMIKGTGLSAAREVFPERIKDVGIAEGYGISYGAGLSKAFKKPYVAIYSTFLLRGYGQIIHDISLEKLPVRFIVDRAGIVGEDGKTHHGLYDIGMFTSVPGFTVVAPTTKREYEEILEYSKGDISGPIAIRVPRGSVFELEEDKPLIFGKWKEIRKNSKEKNLYIATGSMLCNILEVEDTLKEKGLGGTIVSAAFIKPFDERYLLDTALNYENIFVLEEGYKKGSFGSEILEFLNENNKLKKINMISIDTGKVPHGKKEELQMELGLKGEKLIKRIERCLDAK